MTDRRTFLKTGLGGLGAATMMSWPGIANAAGGMTTLGAMTSANFHQTMAKVLGRSTRLVVPSYRFGLVMRSGISASGSSGAVQTETAADLVGVDAAMMRVMAHRMFGDLIERLRATGRTLVGWDEITATKGFAKIDAAQTPFVKKPFADARTIAVVAPEYLPLVNLHLDAPLSDQSPLSLGNWRAMNSLSAELKALVMIPSVVFDFAALTGSGHKVYGGSAQTGIQPGLYLVPLFTQLHFFHAKIALAGEGGRLILEDRVAVGRAGQLVQTGSFNNRAEIDEWNAYVASGAWWTDPHLAGPARPTQAYDYSSWQYRADPDQFGAACLDGARAVHAIFAGAVHANPSA